MSTEIVGAGGNALAAASATGGEKLWGEDSAGAASELLLRQLWTPQVSNFNPAYGTLQNTRRALNRVRSGIGPRMNINFVGHSAVMGQGAGAQISSTGIYATNAQQYSQPAALVKKLKASGIPARGSSFWGVAGLGSLANVLAYDPRLTLGANTYQGSGEPGICFGGGMINATNSGGGTFTPAEPWDTGVLYSATYASGGTWTLAAPGATSVTQPAETGYSVGVTSIGPAQSVVSAVQALTFSKSAVSSSNAFMIGLECYQSTVFDVNVRNLGWSGAKVNQFNDTTYAYSTLNALTALGGDLTIIECFRNDQNAGTLASAWKPQMQTLITAALAFGDVILVRDHAPLSWTYTDDANYNAALRSLSETNNIPLFDIPARMGTGAQASGLGLFCPDNVHYTGVGWSDIGSWIGSMLVSL